MPTSRGRKLLIFSLARKDPFLISATMFRRMGNPPFSQHFVLPSGMAYCEITTERAVGDGRKFILRAVCYETI